MRYIFYALIIYFIILLIRVYRDKKTGNKFDLNSNKTIGGKKNNTPKIIKKYRSINKGESVKKLHDMYFYFLNQIHEEHKKGNIRKVLKYCQASLQYIEPLILFEKKEYGSFKIKGIPAIDYGLRYFSVHGIKGQIDNIKDIVDYFPELEMHKKDVEEAYVRKDLSSKIYKIAKDNPDILQSSLKKEIGFDDGRFISNTVKYMEDAGLVKRKKEDRKIFISAI